MNRILLITAIILLLKLLQQAASLLRILQNMQLITIMKQAGQPVIKKKEWCLHSQ